MDVRAKLRETFGFEAFRPGQEAIVEAVLEGRDLLAVMPTGAGKSLCYQLPATLLPGLTLVVSPLIALMKDQVDALREHGIAAALINSSQSAGEQRETLERVRAGEVKLLYVAPERFGAAGFLERIQGVPLSLMAIDEAHCISQWGHQFRPDYTRLGEVRELLAPERLAGFTATATQEVRDDIARELRLRDPMIEVHGFDRPELFFGAEQLAGKKLKAARVLHHLGALREQHGEDASAIVYCGTRKDTEALTELLRGKGVPAIAYHAGLGDEERAQAQDAFMSGETPVVVATNAFGMGVDKADIRLVLHHDLPGSVEAYYQEAGRAGRDGEPAKAILLWGLGDLRLRRFFIEKGTPSPADLDRVWERLSTGGRPGQVRAGTTRELAERAGVEAGVVPVILRLLEKAGHLRPEEAEEDEEGRLRLRLLDTAPRSGLRVDREGLLLFRQLEEARLERMVTYAGRALCRRRALLDYFGDRDGPAPGELCGSCDACEAALARGGATLELSEASYERVRAALALVDSTDFPFGRRKLAAALAGEDAPGLERTSLVRHPAAGSFACLGGGALAAAEQVLDRCVGAALLSVHHDPYPVITITARGRAVLAGAAEVPGEIAALADEDQVTAALDEARARERAARAAAPRRRKKKGAPSPESFGPVDEALFERLRELRSRLASEQGVPPYVIFHDKHLAAIAALQPRSEEALLGVPGMGPKKLEKYGAALLELLRDG
ncbi:MAG: RecQ family ATP-dependent DNA helicase [Deltaproteobacteria bacterium]|nr:RecQ family ATP-dependent DNA helicase [Deltaproteobacteria bacterium]